MAFATWRLNLLNFCQFGEILPLFYALALVATFNSGNSQNLGRNRANGKPQQRKIKGNCWNCGKLGHSHTDCRAPPSKFAFKPRRNDNGADSREDPIALITKFVGGNKGTWAGLVETDVALLYGQGTVCMEGIDGTTF